MKNDEMLCGLYDYLEQAEDDYFGHDCLLEVWNLWRQNYAPDCPEIIEHHMFPKYYGDSPGYPIDDGVLYFGLDTEDCYELVLTEKGKKLEEAVGGLERYRTEWAEKGSPTPASAVSLLWNDYPVRPNDSEATGKFTKGQVWTCWYSGYA